MRLNKIFPLFSVLIHIVFFIYVFSFCYFLPRDPDLGWHLRNAERTILHQKIINFDNFSHTFRGQSLVNSEWLSEALFYILYSRFSFLGLAIGSGVLSALAFYLPTLKSPNNLFVRFFIISWAIFGSSPVLAVGARPQLISLFLFSTLLVLLFNYDEKPDDKKIFVTPLLLLLWANLHPAFFLAFPLISLFLFVGIIKILRKEITKKQWLFLLFVLITSFFLTYLRPQGGGDPKYFISLMREIFAPAKILSSSAIVSKVRFNISEWLPPTLSTFSGTALLLAIVFSFSLTVLKPVSKIKIRNVLLVLGFAYFSTLSKRNVPFFFLAAAPIVFEEVGFVLRRDRYQKIFLILNFLAILCMTAVSLRKIPKMTRYILEKSSSLAVYNKEVGYPDQAIKFIKENHLEGNMFNHYNWGGFLIWQLPEYPVFIDGRVPGGEIFTEYLKVTTLGEGYQKILDKYKVKFILYSPNFLFEEIIKIDGEWEKIYSDEKAVILVRKKTL